MGLEIRAWEWAWRFFLLSLNVFVKKVKVVLPFCRYHEVETGLQFAFSSGVYFLIRRV